MTLRLFFPNSTRPKKAAKEVAQRLALPLAQAQRGVACACGYADWHELETGLAASPASLLDQDLPLEHFLARQTNLSLALAETLGLPHGDAQYALAAARLSGDRATNLADQIAIRIAILRATSLPIAPARSRGAIGRLKVPGWKGEVVILREFGQPTDVLSHRGFMTVANFEYVSPREPPPLFVPMRLYLPYGIWTEPCGAEVLFSRDYKPLWRVRAGAAIERVEPWIWIEFKKQRWLWDDAETPWSKPQLRQELETRLERMGIKGLPILTDALPLLLDASGRSRPSMRDAASLLQNARSPALPAEAA